MKNIKNNTIFFTEVYNNDKVIDHYLQAHKNVGLLNVENEIIKYVQRQLNQDDLYIADLGCGTGRFAFNCVKKYSKIKVDGFDISSKMIEAGLDFEANHANVNLCVADLTTVVYEQDKYDLMIFTFNSLMTMPGQKNKITSLQNAFNALKCGGYLIFSAPQIDDSEAKVAYFNRQKRELENANDVDVLIEKVGDCFWQENDQYGILCHYNIDELKDLINQANLPDPVFIKTRDEFGIETENAQDFSDNALYVVIRK